MVDIIPFIDSVENITAPENGRDIETDDELKQRIYLAPNGYTNGGTDGAYAWEARQFDQTLADIKVFLTAQMSLMLYRFLMEESFRETNISKICRNIFQTIHERCLQIRFQLRNLPP